MRVLVTGGAGFIGSTFIRKAIEGEFAGISQLTVLDKLTYAGNLNNFVGLPPDSFDFVKGDICDSEVTDGLAKRHDVIINFAAESHVDRSICDGRNFVTTNVLGTQTLLQSSLNGSVAKFIQVSTDEVYGSINNGSWTEEQPLLPNSPYAASKASADLIARSYHRTYGLDVRITRSSNNYGPRQFPEKIIPLFVSNLYDGLDIPIYGDGLNVRDWLHVDDHCRGIYTVLMGGSAGEIYNIGGGSELSNIEISQEILWLMGEDKTKIRYVSDRLGHDFRYSVDCKKIQHLLGFRPLIDLKIGLAETVRWYQENESWWRPLKS